VSAVTRDWRAQYRAWAQTVVHAKRVAAAVDIVERAAARGNLAIAMSWGKDSVAVADLVLGTLGRRVPVYHLASAYALPGGERVEEHFRARTSVDVVPARRSANEVIEWLREVGLGYERSKSSVQAAAAPKKSGGAVWCEQHGCDVTVLGMRAEEARGRRENFRVRGAVYTKADGLTVACPIAWWESRDVWAYIVARDLPYHALYDLETHGLTRETLRNTGWLTTVGAERGRIAWLATHYPEQYRRLEAEFPRVRMLR